MTPPDAPMTATATATATTSASTAPRDSCVICLEPITEECLSLPCKHRYDYICLLSWLQLRPECPLCKAHVQFIRVFNKDTGKAVIHRVEQPKPLPQSQNPQSATSQHPLHHHRRPARNRSRLQQAQPVAQDIALLQRRHIYRAGIRSLHVGANRISRFRNFTPRMVREDEELQSRAKMWIRRELRVFEWIAENSEFLLEYIMAILRTIDIKSSTGAAEDMLTEFLGRDNARTFLHELHAFLRSPFTTVQAFDSFVQYEQPLPTRFDADGHPLPSQPNRKRDRESAEDNPDESRALRRRRNIPELPTG